MPRLRSRPAAIVAGLAIGIPAGFALSGPVLMRASYAAHGPQRPGIGCRTAPEVPCSVLFIGNGQTYVHDLPEAFRRLGRSGGRVVATGLDGVASTRLQDHLGNAATGRMLASRKWNVVVLQDHSLTPALPGLRDAELEPSARGFATEIARIPAQPVLFETWAWKTGVAYDGLRSYASMQDAIREAYSSVAGELGMQLAPAGEAFRLAAAQRGLPDLWEDDDSLPTFAGTYLAACVFYARIFGTSPEGLSFHGGLDAGVAGRLQTIAGAVVGV